MRLAEELADAMEDDDVDGDRVALGIGQRVEVRTKRGELVAVGQIQELAMATHTIRIADRDSGSDMQLDVDPDVYDVWVVSLDVVGDAPTPGVRPTLGVKPSRPGAYTGGRF